LPINFYELYQLKFGGIKVDTIIVVDFGTSAVKSFLYDLQTGKIIGSSEVETKYYTPEAGAAETDAEFWWSGLTQSIKKLTADYKPESIKGISITNQQISCVFLDQWGQPVYPALLWMDTRCTDEVENLLENNKTIVSPERDSFSEWVLRTTGIPPSDSWGLAKVLWFKSRFPEKYKTVNQIASVDAFIIQRLCGRFVSDETNACFFHLDIRNRMIADDLLHVLELSPTLFPEIVPPGSNVGHLLNDVADELGLPRNLPVILAGSDQPCAMLGMGIYLPGEAVINLGSGSFLLTPLKSAFVDERLMTNISVVPDQWLLMGTHYLTGSAFRWLRDLYGADKKMTYEDLDDSASLVKPGSDGLIFLPSLSGSGTPLWDSKAQGLFAGLGLQHTIGHFARSVMESTGFGLRNILEVLRACNIEITRIVIAGGATVSTTWTHSIADILGVDLEISDSNQATPLGAAILGSVAIGRFLDIEAAVKEWIKPGETIKPDIKNKTTYEHAYDQYLYWRDAEHSSRASMNLKYNQLEVMNNE
jgi:xylulokinase